MNTCSKCGNQIDDTKRFCNRCGAMIIDAKKNIREAKTATDILKNLGSSSIFLAAVIAYTLTVLVSVVMASANSNTVMGALYELAGTLGMQAFFVSNVEFMYAIVGVVSFIASIFGSIPSVVMAIGLWLCFFRARRCDGIRYNTSGLTLIKIVCIIELVLLVIKALLSEVILLVVAIVMSGSFSGASAVPVLLVAMLLMVAAFGVGVYFYIKVIKTVNSITKTAASGVPNGKVSSFVGVYCFVLAALSLIVIFTVVSVGSVNIILSALESILLAIYSVCFGILIFKYRKETESIKA